MTERYAIRRLAVLLSLLVAASGCVGPSRTATDYRRKVANSAEAVVSSAESARLTATLAAEESAPAPYVSLRLSEDEEAIAAVETALGSVQPPSARLDDLRAEALEAIGDAADVLEELRLWAYRGELDRLPDIAKELEEPLAELRRLMEIAPT